MKNILFLFFFILSISAYAGSNDSIGTKIVDGKLYIMHKVAKGEGVYGIGRKYGVPASEIFASNEGSEKSIMIGQILLIPKGVSTADNSASSSTTTKTEKVYHTVAKGQTLSTIAKLHSTSVAKIKEWNKLKTDNIQLGQKLVVGEKTVTVAVKTKSEPAKPVEKPAETKPVSDPNNNYTAPEKPEETQKNVVVNPKPVEEAPVADKPGVVNTTYSTDDGDEVSENGIALISNEGELGQDRSFIIHPTAKIGTIVMITNPVNNNTVFARVVANCKPESGFILKMSQTVASKLGVSESTEVKVSYAK